MRYNTINKNKGFTLIEIMVSVAIFSIIMTVGIGALVSMMNTYKISQQEKKAADSLSFVLETITRETRLGSNYYSEPEASGNSGFARDGGGASVSSGRLLGFDAADNRGYIIYRIDSGILYRDKVGSPSEPMTDPSQVFVSDARITVMNAGDPNDQKQPLVWMKFIAYPPERPDLKKVIQTLVSQRILDF